MKTSSIIVFGLSILCIVILIYFCCGKKETYGLLNFSRHKVVNADMDPNGLININPDIDEDDELPFLHDNYEDISLKYDTRRYIKNHRQRNTYNSNVHNNKDY